MAKHLQRPTLRVLPALFRAASCRRSWLPASLALGGLYGCIWAGVSGGQEMDTFYQSLSKTLPLELLSLVEQEGELFLHYRVNYPAVQG